MRGRCLLNVVMGYDLVSYLLEKARRFDPLGHAGLTLLGKIVLTSSGKIKMTPAGYEGTEKVHIWVSP